MSRASLLEGPLRACRAPAQRAVEAKRRGPPVPGAWYKRSKHGSTKLINWYTQYYMMFFFINKVAKLTFAIWATRSQHRLNMLFFGTVIGHWTNQRWNMSPTCLSISVESGSSTAPSRRYSKTKAKSGPSRSTKMAPLLVAEGMSPSTNLKKNPSSMKLSTKHVVALQVYMLDHVG